MPGYHVITIGEASPVVKRYELVSKCGHENLALLAVFYHYR